MGVEMSEQHFPAGQELFNSTAPCGLDCFNCPLFGDNVNSAPSDLIDQVEENFPGTLPCRGCREQGCPLTPAGCQTRICVLGRGHDFCYQCESFPCIRLHPVAEGAAIYPHNMKIFNLLRISRAGVEKWARESRGNRDAYFRGRFHIGTGPMLFY